MKISTVSRSFFVSWKRFSTKNCTSPSTSIPWRRPACHNFQLFCHIYPFYILRTLWLHLVTLTIDYNSTFLQSASQPSTTNCLETDTSHFINVSQNACTTRPSASLAQKHLQLSFSKQFLLDPQHVHSHTRHALLKAFGPGGIPSGSELGGPEVYRGNASCKVTTPRVYPLVPTITFASNEPPMHNTATGYPRLLH